MLCVRYDDFQSVLSGAPPPPDPNLLIQMQMQQQAMLMMNQMGELQLQIGGKGGKQPAPQVGPHPTVQDTGSR